LQQLHSKRKSTRGKPKYELIEVKIWEGVIVKKINDKIAGACCWETRLCLFG
jgi:hypothetical protein